MISDQAKSKAAAVGVTALAPGLSKVDPQRTHADVVACLVKVKVRVGYNFTNADEALGYSRGICGKVASGRSHAQLIRDIKSAFHTSDEFQASHLIAQATNELCPASIRRQLRDSAAGYRSEAAP